MVDVFVSHSNQDLELATHVVVLLRDRCITIMRPLRIVAPRIKRIAAFPAKSTAIASRT